MTPSTWFLPAVIVGCLICIWIAALSSRAAWAVPSNDDTVAITDPAKVPGPAFPPPSGGTTPSPAGWYSWTEVTVTGDPNAVQEVARDLMRNPDKLDEVIRRLPEACRKERERRDSDAVERLIRECGGRP